MKKLILKLTGEKVNSLGFDILWVNPDFEFVTWENLGVFDQVEGALQDGKQGHLVVGAWNDTTREISGTGEIASLEFKWKDGASNIDPIVFNVTNLDAKDSAENAIPFRVVVADYAPEGSALVEFVWR